MSNNKGFRSLVWIVSGPSGSGKTTLCEALLKDPFWRKRIVRSVSYTTRPLRPGEKEGRDYVCVPPEKFRRLRAQGAFLESEKIFGFYYATPKKAVREAAAAQKDLLLSVDVKGAQSVRSFFKKDAVSIFILPPHLGALSERLVKRSTEDKKDIAKRLKRVKIELSRMKDYDYIVVNDEFQEALNKLKSILTATRCEGDYVLHSVRKSYR